MASKALTGEMTGNCLNNERLFTTDAYGCGEIASQNHLQCLPVIPVATRTTLPNRLSGNGLRLRRTTLEATGQIPWDQRPWIASIARYSAKCPATRTCPIVQRIPCLMSAPIAAVRLRYGMRLDV